jgi:hypothetical protein
VLGGAWWCLVVLGGAWWCMMVHDGARIAKKVKRLKD